MQALPIAIVGAGTAGFASALFHSHRQSWGWLRDAVRMIARHNPIGRHHAVSTLVGGRQNW